MSDWSSSLQSWEGDIQALVDKANEILPTLTPPLDLVTLSLVRHYQSRGLVGRGTKKGRQAFFGLADLQALIETKRLATDGWGLDKVSRIYRATANDVANGVSYEAVPDFGGACHTQGLADIPTPAATYSMGLASSSDPAPQVTRAMEVVQSLMRQGATSDTYATSQTPAPGFPAGLVLGATTTSRAAGGASLPGPALARRGAVAKTAVQTVSPIAGAAGLNYTTLAGAASSTSTLKEEVQSAVWLTSYLDVRRLQQSSPAEIDTAIEALRARCHAHLPPKSR
jgi:hypothetical protein